jgi:hypothetical protein
MAVTNNLKKQVDLPVWEWLRFAPTATSALSSMATDDDGLGRYIYYLVGQTFYRYDTWTDGWIQLASPPITVTTFASLSYTKYGGYRGKVISCPGNNTLQIAGLNFGVFHDQKIRIVSGAGIGQERTIIECPEPVRHSSGFITTAAAASIADSTKKWKFNQWCGYQCKLTFGTGATQIRKILYNDTTTLYFSDTNYQPIDPWNNTGFATAPVATAATPTMYAIESTIVTVNADWDAAAHPNYTSRFMILSGGIWLFTSAATPTWFGLQYYDIAMDAWYARTCPAGMVLAAFGTDGSIERTGEVGGHFDEGSCDASGDFTMPDATKSWTVDQWRNFQVRITGGPGIGQKRRIVCNTSTVLEVDDKWESALTTDSLYEIYGDTDRIYVSGGAKSAIYEYDVEDDLVLQASSYSGGIANNLASTMSGWKPIGVTSITSNANGILTVTTVPTTKGSGYKVGDILTLADGTGGKVIVETISGAGVVETVSLIACGTNYTVANHNAAGGTGTLCVVGVATRGTVGRVVTSMNHFYKIGDTVTLHGAGGATTGWNRSEVILGVDSVTGFDIDNSEATATATIANTNSATLICDSTKNWTDSEHIGKLVQCHLVGVAGVVVVRRITANTANTLTVATITTALVNGTGRYHITDCSTFGREEQYYHDETLSNEGHATSGGDLYIEDTTKNWIGNQWAGYKVRIISGVGRGKELTISSNTSNTLTTGSIGSSPDVTSHYIIMDTFGQCTTGSLTVITDTFKNWNFTGTISQFAGKSVRIIAGTGFGQEALCTAGTATTLTFASSPAVVSGDSFYQILSIPIRGLATRLIWAYGRTDSTKKGKYLYSFRGGATNQIDRYNINTEKFEFGLMTSPQFETYTTGTMYVYDGVDKIYIHQPAGRIYVLDLSTRHITQAGQIPYGVITAVLGNRMEILTTVDGLDYLYIMRHSGAELFRTLIFWE